MSEAPDNHALDRRLAVLEERMNTMQAEYAGALDRFRAETTSALDRLRADMASRETRMASRETEGAKRETRMLLAMAGMIALAVAVLGYLDSQPQAPAPQAPVTINMPPQAPAVPAPASEAAPAAP